MTYMDGIHKRDLNSINDFIALHNENMDVINGVFNKLIAASNRQNNKIFWLNMGLIVLGTVVIRMAGRLDRAEQKIEGLQDIAIRKAENTEEK